MVEVIFGKEYLGNRLEKYFLSLSFIFGYFISFCSYYPFNYQSDIPTFVLIGVGLSFIFCIPSYVICIRIINQEKDALSDYHWSLDGELGFLRSIKIIRQLQTSDLPKNEKEQKIFHDQISLISREIWEIYYQEYKNNDPETLANLLANLIKHKISYIEYRLYALSKVLDWKAPWYYYRLAKLVGLKNALTTKIELTKK
ncbi:MAG: hypothetical protein ABIG60_01925 [Patescibacteria group bacterium]